MGTAEQAKEAHTAQLIERMGQPASRYEEELTQRHEALSSAAAALLESIDEAASAKEDLELAARLHAKAQQVYDEAFADVVMKAQAAEKEQ